MAIGTNLSEWQPVYSRFWLFNLAENYFNWGGWSFARVVSDADIFLDPQNPMRDLLYLTKNRLGTHGTYKYSVLGKNPKITIFPYSSGVVLDPSLPTPSLKVRILLIISIITVVVPIFFFLIKCIYRISHNFHWMEKSRIKITDEEILQKHALDKWLKDQPINDKDKKIIEQKLIACIRFGHHTLILRGYHLTSLPPCLSHLSHLQILDCSDNALKSMLLIPSIRVLNCAHNQIEGDFPEFPKLEILNCPHNLMTSLPSNLDNLKMIDCSHNVISFMPILPQALIVICSHNRLREAPDAPNAAHVEVEANSFLDQRNTEDLYQMFFYDPDFVVDRESFLSRSDWNTIFEGAEEDHLDAGEFLSWVNLLKEQRQFRDQGKLSLMQQLFQIIQFAWVDITFRKTVNRQIHNAVTNCTDKALYYLNRLSIYQKAANAETLKQQIEFIEGNRMLEHVDKVAGAILIEKRGNDPDTERELLELSLLVLCTFKREFSISVDNDSMFFLNQFGRFREGEEEYAREILKGWKEDKGDRRSYFSSHPYWKDLIIRENQDEYNRLIDAYAQIGSDIENLAESSNLDDWRALFARYFPHHNLEENQLNYYFALDLLHKARKGAIKRFFSEKTDMILTRFEEEEDKLQQIAHH